MTQCSPGMKDKLEAQSTELEKLEDDNDFIGLSDMIKELVCNAGGVWLKFVIMQLLNRTLCGRGNTQRPNESLNEHGKRFLQQVEVAEAVSGKLVPPCHENGNAKEKESAHNQHLTSLFLGGTDQARHKAAVDESNDNCAIVKDVHPADVPTAIMVLTNCRAWLHLTKKSRPTFLAHIGRDHDQKKSRPVFATSRRPSLFCFSPPFGRDHDKKRGHFFIKQTFSFLL